ncbi:MAG: hypothetical protein AB7K68_07340 [Bacteriovoracia bacterium]
MASPTRKTRLIRQTKKANKGLRRKKAVRAKGTTPKFKIHA